MINDQGQHEQTDGVTADQEAVARSLAALLTCQISRTFISTLDERGFFHSEEIKPGQQEFSMNNAINIYSPFGYLYEDEDDVKDRCFKKEEAEVERLLASPHVSPEQAQQLQSALAATRMRIHEEAERLFQKALPNIVLDSGKVMSLYSPCEEDDPSDNFAAHLRGLSVTHESIEQSPIPEDPDVKALYRLFRDQLVAEISKIESDCRAQYETRREEEQRAAIEKRIAYIVEAQKEYLLQQIGSQIDYLRTLYGAGLGLKLPDVESRGVAHMGATLGSVSLGLSLRLEIKPTLNIHLLPENALSLEMGDDVESICKRKATVNCVAPHEIAHLVDGEINFANPLVVAQQESIDTLLPYDKKDLKKILAHVVCESAIDGMGYRMLLDYGTIDPAEATQEARMNAYALAFVSTMDALCEKMQGGNTTEFPLILLRMLGQSDALRADIAPHTLPAATLQKLVATHGRLERLCEELNSSTYQLSDLRRREIRKLCRAMFDAGKNSKESSRIES